VTSLLASYEFSPTDTKLKDQLINPSFCRTLMERLTDPFIQIRYNSAAAITNLIICFSEYDIDSIFVFECGLLSKLEELFKEYTNNQNNHTESEIEKINKLMKSIFDLLALLIELYDEEKYKNTNFSIIRFAFTIILNPGIFNEEIVLSACTIIPELLAVYIIPPDTVGLKAYIEFANKILTDNSSNILVSASFSCSLFYLYCYNEASVENVKQIIEKIYTNINFDLCTEIMNINNYIQNFVNKIVSFNIT
jgi:hypothetical protein